MMSPRPEPEPTDLERQVARAMFNLLNQTAINAVHVFAGWYARTYSHGRLTPESARVLARFFCQQQGWMISAEPTNTKEK